MELYEWSLINSAGMEFQQPTSKLAVLPGIKEEEEAA